MLINLLTAVNDNYQSGQIEPIFEAKIFSVAQQWIISIIAFAITIIILVTIIIFCLYGKSENAKKPYKYLIIVIGLILIITFLILGITAINTLR